MKKIIILIIYILSIQTILNAQDDKVDNLNDWAFQYFPLDIINQAEVTPIGIINFKRVNGLDIPNNITYSDKLWFPTIEFQVSKLKDSTYCKESSKYTTLLSSCIPPNTGGDSFIIGNYIFLNINYVSTVKILRLKSIFVGHLFMKFLEELKATTI